MIYILNANNVYKARTLERVIVGQDFLTSHIDGGVDLFVYDECLVGGLLSGGRGGGFGAALKYLFLLLFPCEASG